MIVVIPSNRQIDLANLAPLIEIGARFIVIDDTEGSIRVDHPQFEVHNWNDRRRILGDLDPFFPRRNAVCRTVGFYVAWKESDPDEILVTLDDDCRVYHHDFAARVEAVLSDAPRPVATCSGRHLNPIDLYEDAPPHVYPRGFPYSARVAYEPATIGEPESRQVMFSLGLWKGAFDINAADKVSGPPYVWPDIELKHESVVIERGHLLAISSMNMHMRRGVIPAAFQVPMNIEVIPGAVINRYGDIWGGYILKTMMDLTGDALAAGGPMIHHVKHGNLERELWGENISHQINDEFLELLAKASSNVEPGSYIEMMSALTDQFERFRAGASPLMKVYLETLVPSMRAWTKALSS